MKFKFDKDAEVRGISLKDGDGDVLDVQPRLDGKKGLYFNTTGPGVFLTRAKALKLAWAIIDELDPDQTKH